MAIADIRQRPGVLLGAAILLHVVLISAQVNTKAGLPVLQVVTFGSFSEVQRGTMALVDGVRGVWTGYVGLQNVQRENAALKQEVQSLQIRLQEERALAQRTDNLRQLLELRERAGLDTTAAEVIAAAASPEFRTVTIDKGIVARAADRHGGDFSGGRGRPGDPARRPRLEGAVADRPQRRGRRADRAHAHAGRGDRLRRRLAAHAVRAGHRRT